MIDNNGFFGGSAELAELLMNKGKEAEEARQLLARGKEDMAREIKDIGGVLHRFDVNKMMWVSMDVPIPNDDPVPDGIQFYTLKGLVDYINENTEGLIPDDGTRLILQVVNESSVALLSQPSKNKRVRNVIAYANAHVPRIEFERYMDIEAFNTMLLSKFLDTKSRQTLFSVVSSLTKEQNLNAADDGVSQVVTVKQGVSMASNVKFKNPVPLTPMRTFSEIEQPESNFTMRVNEDAKCALYESDGGAWKNVAVERIKDYLQLNIENPAVVVMA